jgi:hypothetical protein
MTQCLLKWLSIQYTMKNCVDIAWRSVSFIPDNH